MGGASFNNNPVVQNPAPTETPAGNSVVSAPVENTGSVEVPTFEENNDVQAAAAVNKAIEAGNIPAEIIRGERKLPEGLNVDENGQLWLDVEKLVPNPFQPRREFDEEALQELSESIREHGILQPITVEDAENGSFYIIMGERRTRAAKLAGLSEVPVNLGKFNDQKKLEIALIENIQRENLNPIEEAEAYYKLMEISGLSQEQVSARVGKNRSTVANAVRLLKLPEDMRNALAQGKITSGHARALLAVKDSADMRILFAKIVGNEMNVRDAEEMAKNLNGENPSAKPKKESKQVEKDPNIKALEQQFIEKLGTKVEIKGNMEKGTLEVSYFNKDDLNRLFYLICGSNN
ncbi:MAG: ParB/RepB/Spo0J family partition protein [Treponema sp.]|nr:ParB/RepB/Spo0J family partition protein [Candidatus Treponema equifaecale]